MSVKVYGLTGTTGAGKSTVANILKQKGFAVIDADIIAREVMVSGSECVNELALHFGNDILNEDGSINRRVLAKKAFSSESKTLILNSITHPYITERMQIYIDKYKAEGKNVVLDAPQLFEAGAEKLCDYIIAVICPVKTRIKRIIERDNITESAALERINAQHTDEFFKENSDYILVNDGDMDSFLLAVYSLVGEIIDEK